MRTFALSTFVLTTLLSATAHTAVGVNCDQVRRYLRTGRSAEDVSETMVIKLDEVKKCQQAGAGQEQPPASAPTPPPGGSRGS